MKIGEIAKLSNIPIESIRYYEKIGLLPSPARQASGYRDYRQAHLDRLLFIKRCRNLDMAQEEIRELIRLTEEPAADCGDIDALIVRHLEHVRERLQELGKLEQTLEQLRSACTGSGDIDRCGILLGLKPHAADAAASPADETSRAAVKHRNHVPGPHRH